MEIGVPQSVRASSTVTVSKSSVASKIAFYDPSEPGIRWTFNKRTCLSPMPRKSFAKGRTSSISATKTYEGGKSAGEIAQKYRHGDGHTGR